MPYVPRLADGLLSDILDVFPAVLVLGPRAVGKTTTARRFADLVVALDDPAQAAQFHADPSAALGAVLRRRGEGAGPVLLDEWQQVPEVLGAVKRAIDQGAAPGSFILTGSVRASLTSPSWPGTGRVIAVDMYPITMLEQRAATTPRSQFVECLFVDALDEAPLPCELPDLADYVDLAVMGGYPPVVRAATGSRRLWLESYVEQLVLRDVPEVGDIRDPSGFRRLLRALVENTGTLTPDTELAVAADINVKTVRRHERLLEDLRIITSLPPWHSNRMSRLVKQRKRYAVDTGLATTILGADAPAVLARGDLLGRVLETFVLAQLRPLLGAGSRSPRAHHLRQQDGRREVDVVLEAADGHVAGLEIKASASPSTADARHLAWLREELGERFVAGVVLHTGAWTYRLGERITAVPIAALWGESA